MLLSNHPRVPLNRRLVRVTYLRRWLIFPAIFPARKEGHADVLRRLLNFSLDVQPQVDLLPVHFDDPNVDVKADNGEALKLAAIFRMKVVAEGFDGARVFVVGETILALRVESKFEAADGRGKLFEDASWGRG